MIRAVLTGACSAIATLAGLWLATASGEAGPLPVPSELVEIPTIAAPVFRDGSVHGYLLLRVTLEIGERAPQSAIVPPRVVLADAVLAHVLGNPDLSFDAPEALDHERLRGELARIAQARIGDVRHLYLTQLDFLSKVDIRNDAIARRPPGDVAR